MISVTVRTGVRFVIRLYSFALASAILCTAGMAAEPLEREPLVPFGEYDESAALVLMSRYKEAEVVFDRFIANHPDEPAGYLLKATVVRYVAMDYEDGSRERETETLLKRAEKLAEKRLKSGERGIWARYMYHSARSLLGMRSIAGGNLLSGLSLSRSGAGGLKKLAESQPEFADAFLGAGSYRFWKSESMGPARSLPLVGDERVRGIDEVKTAVERGKLAGPLANTVLLEMLIAFDAEAAAELGGRLVQNYPECRLFAWQYGEALKKLKRFDDARNVFERLAARYAADPADDGSGGLRCWWKLAVLARDMDKTAECRAYCGKVIECGQIPTVKKRQEVRIEGARRILREIGDGREGKGSGR